MVRDRSGCFPRQQGQWPPCPLCGNRFVDVLRHLNHRQSKCADWYNTTAPGCDLLLYHHGHTTVEDTADSPTPDHFPDAQQPPPPPLNEPHLHWVEFPGAARVYSQAATFMDRFHNDQYFRLHTSNVYYPFSGKDEWELVSFILSSGLSMSKVNELLRLKMVFPPSTYSTALC